MLETISILPSAERSSADPPHRSAVDAYLADAKDAIGRCTASFQGCEIENGDGLRILRRIPEAGTEIEARIIPHQGGSEMRVDLTRRTHGQASVMGGFNVKISGERYQASFDVREITTFFSQQTQAACSGLAVPHRS